MRPSQKASAVGTTGNNSRDSVFGGGQDFVHMIHRKHLCFVARISGLGGLENAQAVRVKQLLPLRLVEARVRGEIGKLDIRVEGFAKLHIPRDLNKGDVWIGNHWLGRLGRFAHWSLPRGFLGVALGKRALMA